MILRPSDPISTSFRQEISRHIDGFLSQVDARGEHVSPLLAKLVHVARQFSQSGKRVRPAFGYWGYIGAGGETDEAVMQALASLELLHIGVLVHDDLIDGSDTRRGLPAAHRQFEAWHRECGGTGDALDFGRAMAILLGDQLLVWSGEMAESAGLDTARWAQAKEFFHTVRSEVSNGQVLDICAQYGIGDDAPEVTVRRVLEEKTSRYTVQRPLQFGAALAGADRPTLNKLGEYGLTLGRAFQLRDDVLGVFGDSEVLGKPAGGDLREGKRTLLVTLAQAGEHGDELIHMLGDHDLDEAGLQRARQIITDSGAAQRVEDLISTDYQTALAALDAAGLNEDGTEALREMARLCVERDA